MGHLSESEIVEARVRLVVGLKRYFHGKRVEGLLSTSVSHDSYHQTINFLLQSSLAPEI